MRSIVFLENYYNRTQTCLQNTVMRGAHLYLSTLCLFYNPFSIPEWKVLGRTKSFGLFCCLQISFGGEGKSESLLEP